MPESEADDNSEYRELGGTIRRALQAQKKLQKESAIGQSAMSRLVRGRQAPGQCALLRVAEELNLDPIQLLILREIGECRHRAEMLQREPARQQDEATRQDWERAARVWLQFVERNSGLFGSQAAQPTGELTLSGLHSGNIKIGTVVVGDRREDPPHSSADILALPASPEDLSYLPHLPLPGTARVRGDKMMLLTSENDLRERLRHDILVVGAPTVNLCGRKLNEGACFRFRIESGASAEEERLSHRLANLKDRGKLIEIVDYATKEGRELRRERERILNSLASPGFIDPIGYDYPRGTAPVMWEDYGILTLCRHPWWPDDHIAVWAAGRSRFATMAALKLLSTHGDLSGHPYGGVFVVYVSGEVNYAERVDDLSPRWVTPDYNAGDFSNAVNDRKLDSVLGEKDRAYIRQLLDCVAKRYRS